jgi:hypothetical protein
VSNFVFSGGAPESSNVILEFADGYHVIPKWLVAHLGGTEAVTSPESMQKARTVTFEEFNRKFHSAVASKTLKTVQDNIVSSHLRQVARRRLTKPDE